MANVLSFVVRLVVVQYLTNHIFSISLLCLLATDKLVQLITNNLNSPSYRENSYGGFIQERETIQQDDGYTKHRLQRDKD